MSLLPHVSINLILGLTLPTATLNRLEIDLLVNKVCCFLYHFQILMGWPTLTEHQVVLCFEVFYQFDQQNAHTGAAWAYDPGTLGLAINLLC